MELNISTNRPRFMVTRGEVESAWEYDVITLKLAIEMLESQHKLRDGLKVKPPTAAFLSDVASALQFAGLEGCTADIAYKVYSVVNAQFQRLASDIESQIASISTKG